MKEAYDYQLNVDKMRENVGRWYNKTQENAEYLADELEIGVKFHYIKSPFDNSRRIENWKANLDKVDSDNFTSDSQCKNTVETKFDSSVITNEKCRYALGKKKAVWKP